MKNENNDVRYNIDSLVLTMDCPVELFDEFSAMRSEICYDNCDGFNLTLIDKDNFENPSIFYVQIALNDGSVYGVIKFDKKAEKAILILEKQIFYTFLSTSNVDKVNMLPLIEYILPKIGFELQTVKLENLTIVRDEISNNRLKHIASLNGDPSYQLYLNGVEQTDVAIVEKYFIREEGLSRTKFIRMNKQNAFYTSSILGNLEMAIYDKSLEIERVSHEYFIPEFYDWKEDKRFYRSEITLNNDFHIKQFYKENGIEDKGYFTLCELFDSKNIKLLFDYLSQKLIYFINSEGKQVFI